MSRTSIGIVCGGRSEVFTLSVLGGLDVADLVDPLRYDLSFFVLDETNRWYRHGNANHRRLEGKSFAEMDRGELSEGSFIAGGKWIGRGDREPEGTIDVFFPTIYGSDGEDGRLQGFFEMLGVAYVGCDVTGSALCIDKDIAKKLLAQAGIPSAASITLRTGDELAFEEAVSRLGTPLFVKPCRLGSSVGVSKVRTEGDFQSAISLAFRFGTKVLIEETLSGREIRSAVIGNESREVAATIGEVPLPAHLDFYDYETKLNAPINRIPADLDPASEAKLRALSRKVCEILEIEGMARLDWFLDESGEFRFGEANTLPCLSSGSTFLELWAHSNVDNRELVDRLIRLALQRRERNRSFAWSQA